MTVIETLVHRRRTKYAHDKRCVLDLMVDATDDGVDVVATFAMENGGTPRQREDGRIA